MASPILHRKLLSLLRDKLIPAAREGACLELLEPPLRGMVGPVTSQRARPLLLPRAEPSHLQFHSWPEEGLNTLRVPYLGFVLEGEADIKTGIVSQSRRAAREPIEGARQIIAIGSNSFFLVPPGVPVSCGPRPHWERDHAEQAYSRIFWIHLLPSGVLCHTCISDCGQHLTHPFSFIREAQVALGAELLLRELQRRGSGKEAVARETAIAGAQLLILLLQIERAFSTQESTHLDTAQQLEHAASLPGMNIPMLTPHESPRRLTPSADTVVQRASSYIQANINTVLSPEKVAAHAYISTAHLNRLFKAEHGVPVMQYIARYRHDHAKSLLVQTALRISEVGRLIGYHHPSHFSQVFLRLEGISPQEYRRRHGFTDS